MRRRSQNRSLGHRSKWWLLLFVSAIVFATAAAGEPRTIFLVRHAERAAISGHVPSDTGLSLAGQARARRLAEALKDARIAAIYTTEYKRTQETAAPLARSLGVRPEVVSADDLRSLVAKLRAARGNVLVVGHSNTLPQIISALGISSRVTVAESDYDNLFLVARAPEPQLIRLHYR
jgi:broad specificity phosphatase PhoE